MSGWAPLLGQLIDLPRASHIKLSGLAVAVSLALLFLPFDGLRAAVDPYRGVAQAALVIATIWLTGGLLLAGCDLVRDWYRQHYEPARAREATYKALQGLESDVFALLWEFVRLNKRTLKIEGKQAGLGALFEAGLVSSPEILPVGQPFPVEVKIKDLVWDCLHEQKRLLEVRGVIPPTEGPSSEGG